MGQTGDLSVEWCLGRGRVPTSELRLNMLFTARPPLPGFPHPAPPVLAGSALSGCDIHPDEEGAPPARGAGGAARRDLPAWASAPRPSRRTGTRGRSGSRPRLVPPQPRAAARRSPPPAGRRAAPLPATTAATFPAPPPLRFGLRSPPRPAPLPASHRQCRRRHRILRAAPPRCCRHGAARPGPPRRARRGTVWYGTVRYRSVRYGAARCHRPQAAAPCRANPGPRLSLRPADSRGSQWETPTGRRAPPRSAAPAHEERPNAHRAACPHVRAGRRVPARVASSTCSGPGVHVPCASANLASCPGSATPDAGVPVPVPHHSRPRVLLCIPPFISEHINMNSLSLLSCMRVVCDHWHVPCMSVHGLSFVPRAKGYRLSCAPPLLKNQGDEKIQAAICSRLPTNIKSLP